MKVSIIGSGKVAQSLISALNSIQVLNQVYCRNKDTSNVLSKSYPHIIFTDGLNFHHSESDLFIIAVSDSAIEEVASKIKLPSNALLAHTSGNVSMDSLQNHRRAVFYPLQTFAEGKVTKLDNVPLLLEASDKKSFDLIESLAKQLSSTVIAANSDFRTQVHLAAVFASNFSNRMLFAAEQILKGMGQDLQLLEPLVAQSIQNVFHQGANASLTGPAQRDDQITIQKQAELLNQTPELQELYQCLTKFILNSKTLKYQD